MNADESKQSAEICAIRVQKICNGWPFPLDPVEPQNSNPARCDQEKVTPGRIRFQATPHAHELALL
jgi:hypothetical protein